MSYLITTDLLDTVSAEAAASPRLRRNRNFHAADDAACHRLLNAVEPGTYVAPHRHVDPAKDETMLVLRGRMGVVLFDEDGKVVSREVIGAGAAACGVNIPHGTYHSLVSLETGTVFFEAKAGPYVALSAAEKAPWAPAEGEPGAAEYLAGLAALFD